MREYKSENFQKTGRASIFSRSASAVNPSGSATTNNEISWKSFAAIGNQGQYYTIPPEKNTRFFRGQSNWHPLLLLLLFFLPEDTAPSVLSQQTRVRKFCVDIAPSFIARNIDAALLREHSKRRVCAHYNYCNFCVISPFASTYCMRRFCAKNLFFLQKRVACAKKKRYKNLDLDLNLRSLAP